MIFKFRCLDCGCKFERKVDGDMAEIYLDILESFDWDTLDSLCDTCIEREKNSAKLVKV